MSKIGEILGFDVLVESKIQDIHLYERGRVDIGYRLSVRSEEKTVGPVDETDLENIDFFNDFGVACPYLSTTRRKKLLAHLQALAADAPTSNCYVLKQGFFCSDEVKAIYAYGQSVFGEVHEAKLLDEIELDTHKGKSYEIREVITTIPGFSEVLFYFGRLAVLKPILFQMGLPTPDFILGVFAPSRRMKTTEVHKRCLNFVDKRLQSVDVMSLKRRQIEELKERLHKYWPYVFLLDDFRRRNKQGAFQYSCDIVDELARFVNTDPICASLVLTGELAVMDEMGIYSMKDRFFNIEVPTASEREIQERKEKNDLLEIDTFADVDIEFIRKIMGRFDEFSADAKAFFEQDFNSLSRDDETGSRTKRHAAFLIFAERIFRKFYCGNDAILSGKKELDQALDRGVRMQLNRLKKEILMEDNDLVQIVDMMLDSKTLEVKMHMHDYIPNGKNFLMDACRIYITAEALMYGMQSFTGRMDIHLKDITQALRQSGVMSESSRKIRHPSCQVKHWWIGIDRLKEYCAQKKNR